MQVRVFSLSLLLAAVFCSVLFAGSVVRADDASTLRDAQAAAELTGTTDPLLADWIVRVVLSLLCWPLADEKAEELVVRRYVAAVAPPVARH